jgi:hypothetical protein
MRSHVIRILMLAGLLGVRLPAAALSFAESSDAGDLPATADDATGVVPLTLITGSAFGPADVDVYKLSITDPGSFSAVATGGLPGGGKPRLWLFDAAGKGVAGYVDSANAGASLGAGLLGGPGIYYLVYTAASFPLDAVGNELWSFGGATDVERAPDGPAAANPVALWSPASALFAPQAYSITLTGVPEPGTALLFAAGLAGLWLHRRRAARR